MTNFKLNLQLFAAGDVVNATTSTELSGEMKTFYDKTLITLASYLVGRYWLADLHHAEAIAAGLYSPESLGTSMAFLTLSMAEIFHAFNMRSLHGSIFTMKGQNKWLWGAGLLSFVLTTVVIEVPFLANAFDLAHLDLMEYGIALVLAILVIPIVEIVKLIQRCVHKSKGKN